MNKIISFPRLGVYNELIARFLENTTKQKVIIPPNITTKTKNIATKNSPETICAPFKYNLANYIESLEKGANILLQAGGGCRYGYYAELQEQILKDLGYTFIFYNFIENNRVSIKKIYKFIKKENPSFNNIKFIYNLLILVIKVFNIDKFENYLRLNKAYIIDKNALKHIENNYYKYIYSDTKLINTLINNYKYYHKLKKMPENKNNKIIKIAIVGELYTIMEKEANNKIEDYFINKNVSIYRNTNLTYLLFKKKKNLKKMLKENKQYLKYHLGADGTESVVITKKLSEAGYDGIIHIKSFGCTPEINAMPIMEKISLKTKVPVMYLTYDVITSETNLTTRLEAFLDMLESIKNK